MESRLSGDVAGRAAPVEPVPDTHFSSPLRDPAKGAPEITALSGLRAIASGWVVVDHLQLALFSLFPALTVVGRPVWSGYLAVDVFFLLSGFILAHNYAERVKNKASYQKFLWARVARIFPGYLVTTLIMAVLAFSIPAAFRHMFGADFPINPANAVANLFLAGAAVPPFVPFNPPSWTLTCEFAAYLVFPLLAWAALRLSPRAALAAMSVVIVLGIVTMLAVSTPGGEWPWNYQGRWIRLVTEFIAGMLLWRWWRNRARPSVRWDVVAVLSVLVVLTMMFAIDPGNPVMFTALPFIALLLAAIASSTGPVKRFMSSRPLEKLCELSFSLYLTHVMVLFVAETVLPFQDLVDGNLAVRLGWMAMVLIWMAVATLALYHGVERPVRRRMLAWYARRHPR